MDESDAQKAEDVLVDKRFRKDLDDILQNLKQCRLSRERALARTKLEEAIMWLGMDLKRINVEPNPYPHSYDPTSPTVDPVADSLKL